MCQGDVHNAPIEKMELRWPVLVRRRELRPDSGGAGVHRGGLGLEIEVEGLVEGSWSLTDMGREQFPPWGVHGGRPGATSATLMRRPGEASFQPVQVIRHLVPAGTAVVVATAGGGGWGDPLDRDPERVRRDVIEGYVTLEAARRDYGVVLDPERLVVDWNATRELRARKTR